MWIKICGLTSSDAVNAAIQAGANAIGFVFAPSKRQVTAQQAVQLTQDAPSNVSRVAVMQHPSQALVDEVIAIFKPDVLQTDHEDIATLKIPADLQLLPVIRSGKPLPAQLPTRLLFEGPVSGAGETADWANAASLSRRTQLILAGGLNSDNVSDAIVHVNPFGVDVSSGVESAPGVKDVGKIFEFVRAARAAFSRSN
jgi:phosphoribosylanthranilate isomerase